jgi:hypothetical protein
MKTRFSSALGFALLAASFTFGSSFVYAEAPEVTTSALQTVGPNNETNVIEGLPDGSGGQAGVADASVAEAGVAEAGVAEAGVAEASVAEAQPAEVDQPSSLVSETELSSTDELSPAIRSVDAIVVEVTQTVTIAVPGQDVEDNEDHTGSIRDASATEPIEVLEEQTTELDGAH